MRICLVAALFSLEKLLLGSYGGSPFLVPDLLTLQSNQWGALGGTGAEVTIEVRKSIRKVR